jgi:hypothetical protein
MTPQIGNTEATLKKASTPKPKLLTTEDACILLWGEYSRKMKVRLYRAYKQHKIGSVIITGRHYWRIEDLEALINDVTMAPEAVS